MGSLWMLVAGAGFALMSVFVKFGAAYFSSQELVFWRSALGMLFLSGAMIAHPDRRLRHMIEGGHLVMHLRRGLIGFIALVAFFYAISRLPMSVAITLNYTSPLFLVLLMPWHLNERPRPQQYVAVAMGFVGVILLLRPWQGGGDLLAGLAGLFSGALASLAYIHVRQLGRLHEPEWRTVFWFAAVSAAGAALLATADGWHAPAVGNIGLLLGLGVCATAAQLAMTRAYRKGDTVVVASLAYSTVVFGSLLDGLIWHDTLPAIAWVGMGITVTAGVWAVLLNNKESK
jgi:drug/metabolite transporter (DMT)-like permease